MKIDVDALVMAYYHDLPPTCVAEMHRVRMRRALADLARQGNANQRGLLGARWVYCHEMCEAAAEPKREPDVAAAVAMLKETIGRANVGFTVVDLMRGVDRALRALGEDA